MKGREKRMKSRFGDPNDIDKIIKQLNDKELIKRLNKKQLTSDDCKILGDLYLKKGGKKKAIEYFYKAAEKLSHDQINKAIALYKKILNISSNEINACEGIIGILVREGLVAEQIKYLLLQAKMCQSKGDFSKATTIYRKIQEIDPTNREADLFFSRGKAR